MYLTLPKHLHRQAATQSERTAMIYVTGNTVQKISYRQFYDQVQRLAGWLGRQDLQKGDRGLIIMENCPQWPVSYFGLLLAGGTAVPVDLQSRPEHVNYVLEQTKAKVVFASAKAPLDPKLPEPLRSNTWWWWATFSISRSRPWRFQNFWPSLPPPTCRKFIRMIWPPFLHLRHYRAAQGRHADPEKFCRQFPGHRRPGGRFRRRQLVGPAAPVPHLPLYGRGHSALFFRGHGDLHRHLKG